MRSPAGARGWWQTGTFPPAHQEACAAPGGIGLGYYPVTTCTSCLVPASFALTNAFGAFADVALGAFHVRLGAVSPRGELGMHRRVTHLSAELRRLHPVQAAVPGKQNDDDVHAGERHQHERPSAHDWLAEIEHRPVGRRRRDRAVSCVAAATCRAGISSSPNTNAAGMAMKMTRPAYGFSNSPATRNDQRDEHDR